MPDVVVCIACEPYPHLQVHITPRSPFTSAIFCQKQLPQAAAENDAANSTATNIFLFIKTPIEELQHFPESIW